MSTWKNWSGIETSEPIRTEEPADTAAIVAAVERARTEGTTVKMIGTGHSFTAISAPEHTMLRPTNLGGIVSVDRDAMTVTALAGTRLQDLNEGLERLGLSLHNMGDIAEQTLAGATSTGTHGTGGVASSLSAQICGLTLVTGTGAVVTATETENPELLEFARLGLGALGVLTTITFRVEPLFVLEANETPMSWDDYVAGFDEHIANHHHVDTYWFPHTDRMLVKTNDRLTVGVDEVEPLSRWREWLDDEFLSNTLFGALNHVTNRVPAIIPRFNQVSSRLLSARTYSDVAHKVFVSPRTVVFREMEYAVPLEAGLTALRRGPRRARRVRHQDHLPGRDPGDAGRRHPDVDLRRPEVDVPRLPHPPRRRPPGLLRADRADHARPRRPPPLGQGAHPDRGRPGADVLPLRGVPRPARPARPGPRLREPLPAAGPRRLRRPAGGEQATICTRLSPPNGC